MTALDNPKILFTASLEMGYGAAMSHGELLSLRGGTSADMHQAEYFHTLLDSEMIELRARLDQHLATMARYEHVGDVAGARRVRHMVRSLEGELRNVDRMVQALRVRMAAPVRARR